MKQESQEAQLSQTGQNMLHVIRNFAKLLKAIQCQSKLHCRVQRKFLL